MSKIYKEIVNSKDNLIIPVFNSGKGMHSKYAPLREAGTFGSDINPDSFFTIIIGLGAGYHIQSFLDRNPDQTVLVIEESDEDINFLKTIPCVKNLFSLENVNILSRENIVNKLPLFYLPAIHGGINILTHRAWFDNNEESAKSIIESINETLKFISRDYSVQCHFGSIWQRNIMLNLRQVEKTDFIFKNIDKSKTALILAAGPSLDLYIDEMLNHKDDYYIIATDTALSSISKYKIKCDCVVSIDGQNISYKHFIGNCTRETLFIFDLQANSIAVKHASSISQNIIFTKSGHPFAEYVESISGNNLSFNKLDAGSGTVTMAALDFAKKSGFKKAKLVGADFSYILNKPYAKGTYLDSLYRFDESKICCAENKFTNLIYRTEVSKNKLKIESTDTTQIHSQTLDLYKDSFIKWLKDNNFNYEYKNLIYNIDLNGNSTLSGNENFSYKEFIQQLKIDIEKINIHHSNTIRTMSNLEIALLPYVAAIRNTSKNYTYIESLKLALSKILEYTL